MKTVDEEIRMLMKEWKGEELYEILSDEQAGEWEKIVNKLVSLGKPAVPHLVAMLDDQDTWNPLLAADAFGGPGNRNAF